jgi:hypothetical protein
MNRLKENQLIYIALVVVLFFAGCGGGAKQADDSTQSDVSKESTFKSVTKYPIPTALEVTKMLNDAGASYILSLNNPTENVDKYFTAKSRALNLGVYGANLSYASTYQMKQETMNYLSVAKKLIDELQITSAFNVKFADRVQSNIDNKDSLINIVSQSFFDTYEYLTNNGKDNVSLLVMTGSWVEGLYITSQIALVTKQNEDFMKIIAIQKEPLIKLMELMSKFSDDAMVAEVIEMLKPLQEIYKTVDGESLTPESYEKITTAVTSIRETIIKG